MTLVRLFCIGLIGLLLMSCASTEAVTAPPVNQAVRLPSHMAAAGVSTIISSTASGLAAAYRRNNTGSIRDLIANSQTAASLQRRMQRWKRENVQDLQVTVVYDRVLGPGRHVATFRFSSDPRSVPWYAIYVIQISGHNARIVGTTSGITGDTVRTAKWSITRTAHFVIYHSPYQLAGADRRIANDLEYQRSEVIARFGVKAPSVASFYLFPDQATMSRLTQGHCGGRAGEVGCTFPFVKPPTIFATMQALYHEPIHVYELGMTPPQTRHGGELTTYYAPLFIGEGTAVALEDRSASAQLSDYCSDLRYLPLDVCARIAIRHLDPLHILSDKGFGRADPDFTYPLSGSFVKYLLLRYGYRPLTKFYYSLAAQPRDTEADYNVAARSAYRASIRALLQQWRNDLCSGGC